MVSFYRSLSRDRVFAVGETDMVFSDRCYVCPVYRCCWVHQSGKPLKPKLVALPGDFRRIYAWW
jgi:hypothetical protein